MRAATNPTASPDTTTAGTGLAARRHHVTAARSRPRCCRPRNLRPPQADSRRRRSRCRARRPIALRPRHRRSPRGRDARAPTGTRPAPPPPTRRPRVMVGAWVAAGWAGIAYGAFLTIMALRSPPGADLTGQWFAQPAFKASMALLLALAGAGPPVV